MSSETQAQTATHVRDNIVKIVNSNGDFFGTGFSIQVNQQKFCITCHHCIYKITDIFIESPRMQQDGHSVKYPAQWLKDYSDPTKDIAVLDVKNCPIEALRHNLQAMADLKVTLWGFSAAKMSEFPEGMPGRKGELSTEYFNYAPKEDKKIYGTNPWNIKPKGSMNVFQYIGVFELGFSGSPVCYTGDYKVVGIFTAKDKENGYVLPIETLLKKFHSDVYQSSETLDTRKLIEEGNQYFGEGSYSEAIGRYDEIIVDKNFIYALANKGLAFSRMGEFTEALKWYDKALIMEPNAVETLVNKAQAIDSSNLDRESFHWYDKLMESMYCLDKALAIDPKHSRALVTKGNLLNDLARYEEALSYYDKALAIEPNSVEIMMNKGVTYGRMGNYTEELKWYDKVTDIDPKNVYAIYSKGDTYGRMGNYTEELKWYDNSLAIEPTYLPAIIGKGASLIDSGNYKDAKIWCQKALDIDPNNSQALSNMRFVNKQLEDKN